MAAPASLQSKQWSCASLAAGNNHLLQVKSEESRQRQADLEARKKAIQAEIEAIQQEERQLEPVPEVPEVTGDFDASTREAEAVMDELPASAKRMPPNSTKTTPVKKLAVVKKRREGEASADRSVHPTAAKSKAVPKELSENERLQSQLNEALALIQQLQSGSSTTPSPLSKGTPSPSGTPSPIAPSSSAKGSSDAADDQSHDHAEALRRYAMVDARLRRLCEKKPSGKLNVPQDIHNMWLAGGHSRDNLRALLEKFEFDKGKFISEVTVMIEKRRENSEKVKSGWFTPDQMRTELKWVSSYIKDAVAYCKKHGLVKNDKYSNKVYKYFVEYSDTATLKKSYIETEKQSSTREGEEVKLGGGFLERPEEPETAPDESERHQALSAQEEELLVEQKFEDGMLAKMSKITDLIARLEGLSKSSPEDSARCTKLVQALEAKIQAAQAAFDTFVECRSQAGEATRTPETSKEVKDKMKRAMGMASALASVEAQGKALEKTIKKKLKEKESETQED